MSKTADKPAWAFAPRFRRGAFGLGLFDVCPSRDGRR